MAKFNAPKDHLFRAGQISSKNWARLSMTANGKGGKTKSKMAKFESKGKDEGDRKNKSIASTKPGHIDGPDQGMAGRGAVHPPTRGGGVHGNASQAGHIDTHQKPNFPRQGAGSARKTLSKQQPSSSNAPAVTKGDDWYGAPNSRPSAPSRLKKVETRGAKF